jgi:hypothetical protein
VYQLVQSIFGQTIRREALGEQRLLCQWSIVAPSSPTVSSLLRPTDRPAIVASTILISVQDIYRQVRREYRVTLEQRQACVPVPICHVDPHGGSSRPVHPADASDELALNRSYMQQP